jgi:predicted short-subunit dehydrogenase-like oxidoreductase (DUF2520 family)
MSLPVVATSCWQVRCEPTIGSLTNGTHGAGTSKGVLVTVVRVIGPGRAGGALMGALDASGQFVVLEPVRRGGDLSDAADGADLLVVATPDAVVGAVAAAVRPRAGTVVAHLSGALGLDVLEPHPRRASLHPLVPLPNAREGARRLRSGVTFAVAGDPMAADVARRLGGRAMAVADDARVAYHAACAIAANHLVALLGQVERVAALAGIPLEAYRELVEAAVDDAFALGPGAALTGPVARRDWATVASHRRVLAAMPTAAGELAAYDALVDLAASMEAGPGVAVDAGMATVAVEAGMPTVAVEAGMATVAVEAGMAAGPA